MITLGEVVYMLIKVKYHDNSCAMVDDTMLDALISADEIAAFCRANGWVFIGRDAVRGKRVERRRKGSVFNPFV
ncbi:MAG: hypothetical protein A2079_06930 [Geobacteraceae bacterium GWC2_48_7]|nr:MAG: hypothetical protein A2079_06930 [Geobacteraceae bacterium GWC2_48_7]